MALKPTNSRQIPDQAILDQFNKQTYIGNSYLVSTNEINIPVGNKEVPICYLSNPSSNSTPTNVGLFQNVRKMVITGAAAFSTFKFYSNPVLNTPGSTIIPSSLRPGFGNSSVMAASLSPTVTGVQQVQTVDTVADVAGSLNNTYFLLSSVQASGAEKLWYLWFDVNSAGTDPMIDGLTGIQVNLSTGAAANTVATAVRAALNALTSDFVATGTINHVIITNVNAGAANAATEGGQPTGFTFHNTTAGSSAFGTFLALLSVEVIAVDSGILFVMDPGSSMLVTVSVSTDNTTIAAELGWYEI